MPLPPKQFGGCHCRRYPRRLVLRVVRVRRMGRPQPQSARADPRRVSHNQGLPGSNADEEEPIRAESAPKRAAPAPRRLPVLTLEGFDERRQLGQSATVLPLIVECLATNCFAPTAPRFGERFLSPLTLPLATPRAPASKLRIWRYPGFAVLTCDSSDRTFHRRFREIILREGDLVSSTRIGFSIRNTWPGL